MRTSSGPEKATLAYTLHVLLLFAVLSTVQASAVKVSFYTDRFCSNVFGSIRSYPNSKCVTNAGTIASLVNCSASHSAASWTYVDYFTPNRVSSCSNDAWKKVTGSGEHCIPFPGKLFISVLCGGQPNPCTTLPIVDLGSVANCSLPAVHGATCSVECETAIATTAVCDNGMWTNADCTPPFQAPDSSSTAPSSKEQQASTDSPTTTIAVVTSAVVVTAAAAVWALNTRWPCKLYRRCSASSNLAKTE